MLFICLPHTSETEGLIGEKELSLLPENAVIVNVGRYLACCVAPREAQHDGVRLQHKGSSDLIRSKVLTSLLRKPFIMHCGRDASWEHHGLVKFCRVPRGYHDLKIAYEAQSVKIRQVFLGFGIKL